MSQDWMGRSRVMQRLGWRKTKQQRHFQHSLFKWESQTFSYEQILKLGLFVTEFKDWLRAHAKNQDRGRLWKLVWRVTLWLHVKMPDFWQQQPNYWNIPQRGEINKIEKLLQNNRTYTYNSQQKDKGPKLKQNSFSFYEGQVLSLSNCYF